MHVLSVLSAVSFLLQQCVGGASYLDVGDRHTQTKYGGTIINWLNEGNPKHKKNSGKVLGLTVPNTMVPEIQ